MIPELDDDDLRALKERARNWPVETNEQDAREISAVVDELLARRRDDRAREQTASLSITNEARRDLMMMTAAIASEAARDFDIRQPEARAYVATHSLALALEIEKQTPR